jgi:hypothetical protein
VFFAERNGPRPGLTKRNAPPAFTQVNAFVGDVQWMAGFHVDQASDKDPPEDRPSGLSFGERTWNGRTGEIAACALLSVRRNGRRPLGLPMDTGRRGFQLESARVEATKARLKALLESLP